MSNKENGGPAFPKSGGFTQAGMNLRDYFAAKAMQGLMASDVRDNPKAFAEYSYQMADAMLKERDN